MNPLSNGNPSAADEFEQLVNSYYRDLYRFAFSLTKSEADAADLTQQTFYIWARKGHQLRATQNAKCWLLTTLHREFLQFRRSRQRFSEHSAQEMLEQTQLDHGQPISRNDIQTVLDCLNIIPENYRVALMLYYLEDLAYKEIAAILDLPLGTVQSRIARGKAQLSELLNGGARESALKKEHFVG